MATELQDDPEYQAFVEDMRKHCVCEVDAPCDAVLAGAPCEQNDALGLDDYDGDW